MSSIANSLDIVKIIKHKPADMAGWFTKFDRFARHPSVWPYMLSSMAGIVIIKSLSVGASGTAQNKQAHNCHCITFQLNNHLYHLLCRNPAFLLILARIYPSNFSL